MYNLELRICLSYAVNTYNIQFYFYAIVLIIKKDCNVYSLMFDKNNY